MKSFFWKTLTALMALTLLAPSAGAFTATAVAPSDYAEYINYRRDLSNTYAKLKRGEEVNIVYFGGSVTNGYGVTDPSDCWRERIGSYIAASFPEATVNNINKACGESGTYLGSYRLTRDVISAEPDLLFLEYSINDKYDEATYERAAYQYETIVRRIKEALPDCDIVTVLVTDSSEASAARKENGSRLHTQAQAHEDMAAKYNIPTLHVGRYLADTLPSGWTYENDWKDVVAIDIVHLTAHGNELYYNVIKEFIDNCFIYGGYDPSEPTPPEALPELQSETLLDGDITYIEPSPELVARSEELGGSGIVYASAPEFATPGYDHVFDIYHNNGEDRILAVEFDGTELIGLFQNYGRSFYVSVDGGSYVETRFYHMNPTVIATGLERGHHVVRMKFNISESRALTRLGALFSRDAEKQTARQYQLKVSYGSAYTAVSGSATAQSAAKGVTVNIRAAVPNGAIFEGWSVVSGNVTLADSTAKSTSFTMVGEAVEIKAKYSYPTPEDTTDDTISSPPALSAKDTDADTSVATAKPGSYVLPARRPTASVTPSSSALDTAHGETETTPPETTSPETDADTKAPKVTESETSGAGTSSNSSADKEAHSSVIIPVAATVAAAVIAGVGIFVFLKKRAK